MAMPPDLDAAFRKFIPPFGAAGNPVDITGGEPPITYVNTVKLGLSDDRIHSLILGYWHTIVTPPMVFASNMVEVKKEMEAKGISEADGGLARRRRRGRGSRRISLPERHSGLRLFDRTAGRSARRQVQVGEGRGIASDEVLSTGAVGVGKAQGAHHLATCTKIDGGHVASPLYPPYEYSQSSRGVAGIEQDLEFGSGPSDCPGIRQAGHCSRFNPA